MSRPHRISRLAALLLIALPGAASALDCSSLAQTCPQVMQKLCDPQASQTLATADRQNCFACAWVVPRTCARNGARTPGTAAGAGSAVLVSGYADPSQPPAVRGAPASVSQSAMNLSLSFPPWAGFPCQLPGGTNVCGSSSSTPNGSSTTAGGTSGTGTGSAATTTSSCPVRDDTTGTFGALTTISGTSSYALGCGGVIPLTTYQSTIVQSPTGMAVTEYGSPYLWVYAASGGGYTGGTSVALPTYLCKADANGQMQQSITLTAPRAQVVEYNAGTSSIAIRLIPGTTSTTASLDPSTNTEDYLIIPMKGGVPAPPANCANQDDYYKPASAIGGDMVIESPLSDGCEGSAQACSSAGISSTPSVTSSCDAVTLYLSGTYSTSSGSISCSGMTQLMVVDRPTLELPPAATASLTSVTGRTAVMANTLDSSTVYLPSGNVIRLPQSGQSFTFPEGATLGTSQGQINMNGPVTINTGTGQVIMTGGGQYIGTDGSTLATYLANSAITPPISFPWLLTASRDVTLPRGYQLLTQPSPYIRAPVQTQ